MKAGGLEDRDDMEDDMDDDTCHEEFPDVCLFSVAMMMMDKVIT